jgi:hypothetical protein
MRHFTAPWFVAGGWALDLFEGANVRAHADVDIAILRQDQARLFDALPHWSFRKAVDGELLEWRRSEYLQLPVHEIHAQRGDLHLEFLLNESDQACWLYRRNTAVIVPLERIGTKSPSGVPYLAPEIVLLYKAKAPRAVDEADFRRVAPLLQPSARAWLASALNVCHPGHAWNKGLN